MANNKAEESIISDSPVDSLKKYTVEIIVAVNGISTDSLITILFRHLILQLI